MPPYARGRRRAVATAAVVAAALGLAACTTAATGHGSIDRTSAASAAAAAPRPTSSAAGKPGDVTIGRADFRDCASRIDLGALNLPADRASKLSFDCATIDVPLDYSAPNGAKITLQLVKIHDSANRHSTGSLLVNPGGPGASGVEDALDLSGAVSTKLLTHFDLVGFDPRGVGSSTPITCLSTKQKDALNAASPNALTVSGFDSAQAMAKSVADACEKKYGSRLAQFNTVQTARDMDLIRQAVGDSTMNYLGFSYGTELGSVYAHLFPSHVRAAVLDGAVDPLADGITSFADQLQGFEGAFDQFATWCGQHSPCRTLGNPRDAVAKLAKTATRTPIPSSTAGETRTATSSILYTAVLSALYSKGLWPTLGNALIQAGGGDSAGLFDLADRYNERSNGQYTNIAEANDTIDCNDSKPGPTDAQIRATAKSWATRFPIFGLWSVPALFTCQQWQPDRTVVPRPTAPTPHKVLVIGNIHDPATPYQGAKNLVQTMGNAELLTWDGEGHTSYLQGSTCIDDYVDDYLISGTLPPAGTTCPAVK